LGPISAAALVKVHCSVGVRLHAGFTGATRSMRH
jgi:hypothetical protein